MRTSVVRTLSRVGVGVVGLAAAAAAFAAPASAADPGADLAVTFTGGTLAANVEGKFGSLTLTNHGPDLATGIVVSFDLSAVDDTKLEVLLGGCAVAGDVLNCALPDGTGPAPGENFDFIIPLQRKPGAIGDAGALTVSVSSDTDDPKSDNNTATVALELAKENGADLVVVADDVYADDGDGDPFTSSGDPVPPGETSAVAGIALNMGDLGALGLRFVVSLPEHVTFAEVEPDCTYSADNREATCEYDIDLTPLAADPEHAGVEVFWPVTVSEDAPGPVALEGGVMSVAAIDVEDVDVPRVTSLPQDARWITGQEVEEIQDVDPSDNADEFTVFVGAVGSGALPETGNRAGLITGLGAAALALGSALVVITRRRRAAAATAGTL